jgi:hypothetical protein
MLPGNRNLYATLLLHFMILNGPMKHGNRFLLPTWLMFVFVEFKRMMSFSWNVMSLLLLSTSCLCRLWAALSFVVAAFGFPTPLIRCKLQHLLLRLGARVVLLGGIPCSCRMGFVSLTVAWRCLQQTQSIMGMCMCIPICVIW